MTSINQPEQLANRRAPRARAALRSSLLLSGTLACSQLPAAPIGQLQVALVSGVGEGQYTLHDAELSITGQAELTLKRRDEFDDTMLVRALPEGHYQAELLDGWRLTQFIGGELHDVQADLLSDNPQPFEIQTAGVTELVFQFQTDAATVETEQMGQLTVAIEVDEQPAPRLLVSELLNNPSTLPDAEGEWLELYNAGSTDASLGGCSLVRGSQSLTLPDPLLLGPGQYLTLANGPTPGFDPDVVYSGLTLPNTAPFELALVCGNQNIFRTLFAPGEQGVAPGQSLSLSPLALGESLAIQAASWCPASVSYNGDLGTPGRENSACPPRR